MALDALSRVATPTYDRFIEPILRYLARFPDGAPAPVVHEAAAETLGLSPADRAETIPSGQQMYKNRAGWAHDRLKRAGLSSSPRRGHWQLTGEGQAFARENPGPLSAEVVWALAHKNEVTSGPTQVSAVSSSPDDRLEEALKEIRESVATDLLERLLAVSPAYFEVVVLDVLHRLGYGTSREDLQRVGGVGDGGIDGVISLDRLGFEKVYVRPSAGRARWDARTSRHSTERWRGTGPTRASSSLPRPTRKQLWITPSRSSASC